MHAPAPHSTSPSFWAQWLPTADCELCMLTYGMAGSPLLLRAAANTWSSAHDQTATTTAQGCRDVALSH